MSAREYLEKTNLHQIEPAEMFQYFAIHVPKLMVLYQKMSKKPILARSNRPRSKYVIAFTDLEATRIVHVRQPEYLEMVEEPALPFLLKAYRSNSEGLMFNPGLSSRFFVVRHQLLEWIRHYSLYQFSNQSSVWIIREGSSILKGVYQSEFSTVAIYTGEHEANKHAETCGGIATSVNWSSIFQHLERIGSSTLFVNYGLPEAFLLNPTQVQVIQDGERTGNTEGASNTVPLPFSDSNQVEAAVTTDVPQLSQERTKENPFIQGEVSSPVEQQLGDWETAFEEDEPLTIGKDMQTTGSYVVNPPITKPKQSNQPDNRLSSKLPRTKAVEELQNRTAVEEKQESVNKEHSLPETSEIHQPTTVQEEQKTPLVSESSESVFDNSWDDEVDSFNEMIPKSSLFFQSGKVKEPEQEPIAKLEQKPVKQMEQKRIHKSQEQLVAKTIQNNQPDNRFFAEQNTTEAVEGLQNQSTVEKENNPPVKTSEIHQPTTTVREEQKVSESSESVFDNPWDDEADGFNETIPKSNLFFQSEKISEPEQEPITKMEQEPVKQLEQEQVPKSQEQYVLPNITSMDDVEHGLRFLEEATNDGQGMANGWEVCRALADLSRIWVIVDMEGKMVLLASQEENQIADFFTSEQYTQTLIDEAHQRNPNLPPMVPRLISTKKLFRALAPTQCIIWINRGSLNAWTSIMGDTLPYVLQLMAQKG